MTSLHLYELTEQHKQLAALAESDDIPPEVIRDSIEGLEGDWKAKAIAVAQFILGLEAMAEKKNDIADAMKASADRFNKRADSLRAYLLFNFQATSTTKVESEWFTLAVKNNPPSVVIDDIALVPANFIKPPLPAPPPAVDKAAVSKAFKAGLEVPGCHPEQGQRLDISL